MSLQIKNAISATPGVQPAQNTSNVSSKPAIAIVSKEEPIFGYKGFKTKPDGTLFCRDQEYVPGREYVLCQEPKACSVGLHFCRELSQVFSYYTHKSEGHVYYRVKGWGRVSEEKDKVAVDHLEVLERVTERELFINFIKPHMDNIDRLVEDNPNVIISGSLALILLGLLPYREIGDLDITVPYYGDFKRARIANQFSDDNVPSGKDTIQMVLDGISFDCFVNPFHTYSNFTFEGKQYRITDPQPIIEAKFKYLMGGKMKHAEDIISILQNVIASNGTSGKSNKPLDKVYSPLKDSSNKTRGFFSKKSVTTAF